MDGDVLVSLLKAFVLLHVVEVVSAYHDRSLHLHALDNSGQYATTDRHVPRERTLLVHIGTFSGLREYKK